MREKMTFEDVYKLFRTRFPNLSKEVIHWRPYSFGTILVYLEDGRKMTYDVTTNIAKPLRR